MAFMPQVQNSMATIKGDIFMVDVAIVFTIYSMIGESLSALSFQIAFMASRLNSCMMFDTTAANTKTIPIAA